MIFLFPTSGQTCQDVRHISAKILIADYFGMTYVFSLSQTVVFNYIILPHPKGNATGSLPRYSLITAHVRMAPIPTRLSTD
jgi:hypothetical protein